MKIEYTYKHAPTIKAFAKSDAYIRGLMGPFGPISGDSDFLTPQGWKRMDQYQEGDLVGQWEESGVLTFVKPQAYIDNPCDEMWHFSNKYSMSMMLSDEHRMALYDYNGKFKVKLAHEVAVKPGKYQIPNTFIPQYTDYPLSDDEIRLRAAINADGHMVGMKCDITVRKQRKKDRLEKLLESCGIEYVKKTYSSRPTETHYKFYRSDYGKEYSGFWWTLSQRQLEIVVDEISHWDGLHDGPETIFFTTSKPCADFIQYAAHATDRRASINIIDHDNPKWATGYRVNIATGAKASIWIRKDSITIKRVKQARKYCFTLDSGFFVARHNNRVFVTGNSGKSTACVVEMIRRTQEQHEQQDGLKHARFAVVRNTYQQLRDTTIKTVLDWLPEQHFGRYNKSEHTYTVTKIPGLHLEILFRALDRPDQVSNLLSLELTGAWINEAREIPWEIVKPLMGRVSRYPARKDGGCTWFGLFFDTNPPDNDSWWFKLFETNLFSDLAKPVEEKLGRTFEQVFKQPSGLSDKAENLPFLEPSYYDLLAADPDQDWVLVHVHGEYGFLKSGQPVYPTYRDNLHCKPVLPVKGIPIWRGWDYGLTPACVFIQILPNGQVRVIDELCATRAGIDMFTDEVKTYCVEKYRGYIFKDIGDPAGMQGSQQILTTCFQIQHGKGVDVEAGIQDLELRLSSVRYGLNTLIDGEPALIIGSNCELLRKGFQGGYNYKRKAISGEARFHVEPDKNKFSHPHDGLQYLCAEIFGELVKGEKVEPGFLHQSQAVDSYSPLDDDISYSSYATEDYEPF